MAPPFPFIPLLADRRSAVKIGAQTVTAFDAGFEIQDRAHTGEVSAVTLKNTGASFAIVGHSERRRMGETDEAARAQFAAALGAGLSTILCVGEKERMPDGSHVATVEGQIRSAFAGVQSLAHRALVAYEPVWAIGKNASEAVSPVALEEMALFIKKILSDILGRAAARKIPILYGGAVEPANAERLLAEGGVAGFLVGHASADADSFIKILKACKK